jgi:circadian clock protein KaiC
MLAGCLAGTGEPMMESSAGRARPVAPTGVTGLDDILAGGLPRNRLYLVEGVPGSGKTTLALQFLQAGAAAGETVLYVTLSETEEELRAVAESHGWDLAGIAVRELTPSEADLDPEGQNTMFYPSEVELSETTKRLLQDVENLKPTRIVLDSLSELRLLAGTALRYRRQILGLKQFFATRACTVVMLDDMTAVEHDLQVHSLAHGVLLLEQLNPQYGSERRRLRVTKLRGVQFRGGYHDYIIRFGGLVAYPRLVASEHRRGVSWGKLAADIPALDAMLGGGIDQGASTLLVGAAGTGKSTFAAQFVAAAGRRGQGAAMFLFDESPVTLLARCRGLQADLGPYVDGGLVTLEQIDPAQLTPGQFLDSIRQAVELRQVKVVVIDSLNGYLNAMPEERFLVIQLHELLMFLGQQGVATIMIATQQGLIGAEMTHPVDASYLADGVVLFRHFESNGEVRTAISVMKQRGSRHERTIHEFRLDGGGIHVGGALRNLRRILTGRPSQEGPRHAPRGPSPP